MTIVRRQKYKDKHQNVRDKPCRGHEECLQQVIIRIDISKEIISEAIEIHKSENKEAKKETKKQRLLNNTLIQVKKKTTNRTIYVAQEYRKRKARETNRRCTLQKTKNFSKLM